MKKLDPRNLAALQVQLDALADQAEGDGDPDLHAAFDKARKALAESAEIIKDRGLFLQIPHDYKPPTNICGTGKPK